MRAGDFIKFADKIWLIMRIDRHHEDPMKNLCGLIDSTGNIQWFHISNVFPEAKVLTGRMSKYIEISQFNYNDKHENRIGNEHKVPMNYAQAQDWADEMGGIKFINLPRSGIGYGLYAVQADGSLKLEYANWDSSD